MDSRWDSERFLFLRLPVEFSIFACNPCKLDHSDRPAFEREKSASSPSFVQALHGQKGEQNSCSLVKDLLLKCVIIITLITHCHWIYFDAKMKHVRCERLLLCCVSRQSVLARGWNSACVELLQPPTEIAFDTDSNDSMCVVPFRTPLGFGSAE